MREHFTITLLVILLILASSPAIVIANTPDKYSVKQVLAEKNINVNSIRSMGHEVMPILVGLYGQGNEMERARIAWIWWKLSWKSPAARAVLLKDINTTHRDLRLQVQWALGRVSDDTEVVDILLHTMKNDVNPLFRDKAACALASDQVHLDDRQRLKILEGLIEGLESNNTQVRDISIKALKIQTGQTKNFSPDASAGDRFKKVKVWREWLSEYESNL